MTSRTDDQLPLDPADLDRYFAGSASVSDQDRVRRWVAGHPDREALLTSLRTAPSGDTPASHMLDVDALWSAARQRLEVSSPAATPRRWWVVSLGGVLGLAAAIVVVWLTPSMRGHEYATSAGSRTALTLRDGSTVVLGPASHLRIPADFGRSDRAVQLEGEALFHVVHNRRHPFAVAVGRTTVRDIGTTFMVRGYADDRDQQIAVTEGQVAVGPVSLVAGDLAIVDALGATVTHHADVSALTIWAQGGLSFRGAALPDVVLELDRTFDLDITVADSSLLSQHITATFTAEPVDEVLAAIALPMGAQVERHGRHVVIRRQSSPVEQPPSSPRNPPVIHIATIQESHE